MKDGYVTGYRRRIILIGQDRAGKTSLKKSLIGLPFDSEEQRTEGIEVDPLKCEIDVDQAARNWQSIGKNKPGLLECSKDVAKTVFKKIFINFYIMKLQKKILKKTQPTFPLQILKRDLLMVTNMAEKR